MYHVMLYEKPDDTLEKFDTRKEAKAFADDQKLRTGKNHVVEQREWIYSTMTVEEAVKGVKR